MVALTSRAVPLDCRWHPWSVPSTVGSIGSTKAKPTVKTC